MMYLLARLLRVIDAPEREYYRRILGILDSLEPIDTRRFMYGRD